MNPRKRKKEPPDSLLPILDLPIASSYLADLAIASAKFQSPFPAFPFPCPLLDFALPSVFQCSQICSPPQPVDGVQSRNCWSRSRPSSATILGTSCVQTWSRCCGSSRGRSSAPLMVLILKCKELRSAIVERRSQGWHICSVSIALFVLNQSQVCSCISPLFF